MTDEHGVQVMVEVRGGKAVKLVIKGEAVLPAVDIQESRLDFGEVYTGVTARIPITIINTTPVLAGQSPRPHPAAATSSAAASLVDSLLVMLLVVLILLSIELVLLWIYELHLPLLTML